NKSVYEHSSSNKDQLSSRSISIHQLHVLPRFHIRPINLIVSEGSYSLKVIGSLILRMASCLDAFSTYQILTYLSSCAPGGTTGTPTVCPCRSSRTKDSSSQTSNAQDG